MSSYSSKHVPLPHLEAVYEAFDRDALARVCQMHETEFGAWYDMEKVEVQQAAPDDFYFFKDNGSPLLGVAHLDTVGDHEDRRATFVDTEAAGTVVFSRALDDRLGAYICLELLPKLGVLPDFLLTTGEESGSSTAAFFEPPEGKVYNWMAEWDRGGTDSVMYQYDCGDLADRVRDAGSRVGQGSFSDIAYLEHLKIKGVNWGVGYQDYHGARAHAYLDDTLVMVAKFLNFHDQNKDVCLPHEEKRYSSHWSRKGSRGKSGGSYGSYYGGSGTWSATRYSQGGSHGWSWDQDDDVVSAEVEEVIDALDTYEDDDSTGILATVKALFEADEPLALERKKSKPRAGIVYTTPMNFMYAITAINNDVASCTVRRPDGGTHNSTISLKVISMWDGWREATAWEMAEFDVEVFGAPTPPEVGLIYVTPSAYLYAITDIIDDTVTAEVKRADGSRFTWTLGKVSNHLWRAARLATPEEIDGFDVEIFGTSEAPSINPDDPDADLLSDLASWADLPMAGSE